MMANGIIHSTPAEVTDGATWEIWYKKVSGGFGSDIIFGKESTVLMHDISGNLNFALQTDSWEWIDTGANITTGVITHITMTYDNSRIKVYVNGVNVYDEAKSGGVLNYNDNAYKLNSRNAVESTLESPGNHTYYIFRIYSRALQSAEVRANYNRDKDLLGV